MRQIYLSRLFILAAILLGWNVSANAQTTTFSYTGAIQTYVVPSGVSYIAIDAQGGAGGAGTYGAAGKGGRVQAVMAVTAGQTYYIYVGGAGTAGSTTASVKAGGWNGGGSGGTASYAYGAGGGGSSDIRYGGTATANRILVAGGGGGAGSSYCNTENGGNGGGLVGANGQLCNSGTYCPCYNAQGGSQSAGGLGGTCSMGGTGTQTAGGNSSASWYGGGGGGGYWGGGGGYYSGGGGGSSYPASFGGVFTSVSHTQGYLASGNGVITITPDPGPPAGTSMFSYTGSIQTWTVPTGVSFVTIDMGGAAGGDSYSGYGVGGCGGRVRATLAVTAGQVYYIYAGGKGANGDGSSTIKTGGWNGGGTTQAYPYCAAGGGATDIRFGGTALANRIFVAGGGGGGGYNCSGGQNGGSGGGLTGASGQYCSASTCMCYVPTGGTQSAGGNNGTCLGGSASTQGTGANSSMYGGAGGGGYWGGGGGYYYASGGGGSSYPATSSGNITGLLHSQGFNCSAGGYVVITPTSSASTMVVFSYTGAIQTYTVPTGITKCSIDVMGASGGAAYSTYGKGGCGGEVTATLAVTPGQILYVYAGGIGTPGNGSSTAKAGGWNGGGSVGAYPYGAGGGGASDIRTGGTAISNRLVVAGGGGGGGYNCGSGNDGGAGGGLTGQNGLSCNSATYCMCYNPTGGTQTAGGNNGTCLGGSASTQGTGANSGYYGGAGGGGYWGGGGAYYYAGGGGGSSYANATYATGVVNTQGVNCSANGVVYITPICTAGTITGNASTCALFTTALSDATTGGAWTSSSTAIATVNSSGVVTGVAAGTCTISYGGVLACGTVYATQVVTVTPPPSAITPSTVCQSLGSTFTSSAGGFWTTANTTIATVAGVSGTGTVTGVAPGTTTVTYSISSTCYVTTPVTVNPTAAITGPTTVCSGLTMTLSDAITGGTWTSSNTLAATVDPSLGIVTGVTGVLSATAVTMSYTLPTGCAMTYGMTVNPLPAVFTGPTAVCKGLAITLTETSTGGTWSSSNTAQATVVTATATTGTVTGVSGLSTPIITYTLPTGCIMTQTTTVNPLPVPITSTGGSCITNVVNPTVFLVDGTSGGTWSVSNTTLATIVSFSGEITGLAKGALTVTYTLTATGCIMTTPYNINPLPAAIAGTPVLCSNAITYLSNTSTGGIWSSSNVGLATVGSGTGIVSGVSGLSNPVISYTLPTGCLALATLTVNPAPGSAIGTTNVCVNSSTTLTVGGGCTWTSSNPGLATVPLGPSTSGVVTGVVAGNPVITYTMPGTGCFNTTAVTVNPVPAVITGPADVCFGSTITLNDVTTGGLWSSGTPATASISAGGVVTPVLAGGGPVTMIYTLGTGCNATYPINVNPLPVAYPVSPAGTSSYCAGSTGIDVKMTTTTAGVNYQLYIGGVLTGSPLPGGGIVDFGIQTTAATYSVVGTNATTGCVKNMSNSPVISINPAPKVYNLSYTGSSPDYCDVPGAYGTDLVLGFGVGSEAGIGYQLYQNGLNVYTQVGVGGTTSTDFGQWPVGVYTVVALNSGTGCQINMTGSVNVNKLPLPAAQTVTIQDIGWGAGNFCASGTGVHVGLLFASTGVDYQLWHTDPVTYATTLVKTMSGANSSLDFGLQTAGGTDSVVGINSITGCSNLMNNNVIVNPLPLPTVYAVSAPSGSSYCIGGNGVDINVSSSDNGVHYKLYNGGSFVTSMAGTTSTIDFLNNTTSGTYTVVASDDVTGCSSNMAGSVNVATYPALSLYNVTVDAPGSVCLGDSLHVRLSGSTPGISYKLSNSTSGLVSTITGTGGPLDFGKWASSGSYTVVAENMISLCTTNMNGSPTITVNSLPAVYTVSATNSGNYCAGGTGQHINLSFSDVGVNYQLWKGGIKVGGTVAGSGASIDFGAFTTPGTYTVTGANSLTACTSNMTGSAVITVNPLPSVYIVTGGGSYCAGSTTGVPVGLSNSAIGINYQLFNGASQVGIPSSGTGSALNFGLQTATGSYTVIATDAVTGCTQNMSGSKVITIDPLPNVYSVTGGGAYCGGGTGVHVGLSNSTTGVQYKLSNGGALISTLTGTTGTALDFGLQTAAGTYTIAASNLLTSCGSNMAGSATVVVNATPLVYTVKGGGSYCAGGAGADIYMSGSEPGINYQLYNGGIAVGSPVMGTGAVLDLGYKTAAGTYTVVASNAGTGCSTNMTGSVTVNINSLPAVYTVTGGGTMCAGGAGYHVNLSGSSTGISYQLLNSGTVVSTKTGTGAALDFGAQTTGGTYTVVATNTTTGCVSNMSGSSTIVVNPAPAAFAVTGGGHYCAEASGVPVGLAGSVPGVNYQLYNGGAPSGMPVGGTGTTLNFGLQKVAGTYTVTGTDMTSTCTASMTGSVAVVVDPMVTPSVSITGTDGTACVGQVTNYTASAVNGGSAPTYVWKVGPAAVSMTGSYSNIPLNGDVVSLIMTSNANCASPTIVTTSVTMNVIPYVMPSATIATDPGNTVCQGTPVTFTATPALGGTTPGYSWLKNNAFVGTGLSYSYTPTATANGDVITFMLRSNERCRMMDTVFSDPVAMSIDDAAAPVVTLQSRLGKIVGVGLVDTFIASIVSKPGSTYTFQWFINGSVVNGETMPIFINHNVFDNDKVSVIVTRNGVCGNQSGTNSTIVQLHNLGATQVSSAGSNISVLPNPSKGEFTVKGTLGTSNDEEVSMEIANMLGQVIYKDKVMAHNGNINEHIKLSNTLANGMYILSLHSGSANDVFHIVIEQ